MQDERALGKISDKIDRLNTSCENVLNYSKIISVVKEKVGEKIVFVFLLYPNTGQQFLV